MDLLTLRTLQQQYQYQIGVEIEKKELLLSATKKKFYRAEWKNKDSSPITLIEIEGNDLIKEIMCNLTLDHLNIVKTYGLVRPTAEMLHRECILLLQEYSTDGNLGELLFEKRFIPDEIVAIEICAQVATGMAYLASHKIIHGDLQTRNVLAFKTHPNDPKKNVFKIIDFGLTQNESKLSSENAIYPIRFAAPEIIRAEGKSGHTEKTDVYAFAVFVWEVFSKAIIPFGEITDDKILAKRKLDGLLLTRPEKCPEKIWSLMIECWKINPNLRPNFSTIHDRLVNRQTTQPPSLYDSNSKSNSRKSMPAWREEFPTRIPPPRRDREPCSLAHHANYQSKRIEDFDQVNRDGWHVTMDSSSDEDSNFNPKILPKRSSALDPDSRLGRPNSSSLTNSTQRSQTYRVQLAPQSKEQLYDPPNRNARDKSKSITPIPKSKLNSSTTERFPCEICKEMFPISEFAAHQRTCLDKEKKRIDDLRKSIEQSTIVVKNISCNFCQQRIQSSNLDDHEKTCSHNPSNVPDVMSPPTARKKRSNSDHRLPHILDEEWMTKSEIKTPEADKNTKPTQKKSFFKRLQSLFK